ncbi:MAG: LapA family protein [Porphyrobacter sp. IPPAS B-1204]|nr:MAG: LapA family protein [Porphyrobacter sp. IPPAS B-1204]
MKILRTVLWILGALGFLIFAIYNWQPVELTLWQNLVLETKVPVLALLAFAAGFLPMWALHRSVVWGLQRRIRALETSLKNTAMARQREAETPTMLPVDSAVEKSGKTAGETADPLSPADSGLDGGSGK